MVNQPPCQWEEDNHTQAKHHRVDTQHGCPYFNLGVALANHCQKSAEKAYRALLIK